MFRNYLFKYLVTVAIAAVLSLLAPVHAQVITHTVVLTNGVQATPAQVAAWNAWRASLVALPYYKLKVTGTVGPSLKECNDPGIVQDIALKLRTLPGPVTTNAFTWVDGTNTWQVGTDISGRLGVNMTSLSNCDNPGYVVKPGIANANWGGWGTATCGGPTQTITIEFWYGTPCPLPTNYSVSNLTSQSATLNWTAVPGSIGYDYYVDQSGAYPPPTAIFSSGTTTSFNQSGLTPNTTYYLHIRNKCSATSISIWDTFSFKTLPPCEPPIGFNVTNLMPTSATINWAAWPSALSYDYVVDQSSANPVTGTTNTLATSAAVSPLLENTWYYVHIRSKCANNEVSGWSLDSFLTPIVCRAPQVQISHINTDEAVAYWDPVPTAVEYEYAINQSSSPPAIGTKYQFTSMHTSALNDGKDYYIHVRSHCVSLGSATTSPWATASFKTFAVGINDEQHAGLSLACYPNPVKDVLHIDIAGKPGGGAKLLLMDMSGRVLATTAVTGSKHVLDMSGYAKGMYMLRYTDEQRAKVISVSKY